MSYQIQYESISEMQASKPFKHRISGVVAVVLVCVLVVCAVAVKTVGLPWVETFLIPGDPEVTSQAWKEMMGNLQDGQPIGDAVTAFCREIIENAN